MFDGPIPPVSEESIPNFIEEAIKLAGGLQQIGSESVKALSEISCAHYSAGGHLTGVMIDVALAACGIEAQKNRVQ